VESLINNAGEEGLWVHDEKGNIIDTYSLVLLRGQKSIFGKKIHLRARESIFGCKGGRFPKEIEPKLLPNWAGQERPGGVPLETADEESVDTTQKKRKKGIVKMNHLNLVSEKWTKHKKEVRHG